MDSAPVREPAWEAARETHRSLGHRRRGSTAPPAFLLRLPRYGARVRVLGHHAIEWCRGMEGRVVGRYGGTEHVALEVLFADGERRMFWPSDLEEVAEGA